MHEKVNFFTKQLHRTGMQNVKIFELQLLHARNEGFECC